MTGPEHYRRAERCLELAQSKEDGGFVKLALAEAQAHATLALAAAVLSAELSKQLEVREEEQPWRA